MENPNRGVVLAEAFPGVVSQGFVHVLDVIENQLHLADMGFLRMQQATVTAWCALGSRVDSRIGISRRELRSAQ